MKCRDQINMTRKQWRNCINAVHFCFRLVLMLVDGNKFFWYGLTSIRNKCVYFMLVNMSKWQAIAAYNNTINKTRIQIAMEGNSLKAIDISQRHCWNCIIKTSLIRSIYPFISCSLIQFNEIVLLFKFDFLIIWF